MFPKRFAQCLFARHERNASACQMAAAMFEDPCAFRLFTNIVIKCSMKSRVPRHNILRVSSLAHPRHMNAVHVALALSDGSCAYITYMRTQASACVCTASDPPRVFLSNMPELLQLFLCLLLNYNCILATYCNCSSTPSSPSSRHDSYILRVRSKSPPLPLSLRLHTLQVSTILILKASSHE